MSADNPPPIAKYELTIKITGDPDDDGDYEPCTECHRHQGLHDAAYPALRAATVPTSPTDTGGDNGLREAIERIESEYPHADTCGLVLSAESARYGCTCWKQPLRDILAAHPTPQTVVTDVMVERAWQADYDHDSNRMGCRDHEGECCPALDAHDMAGSQAVRHRIRAALTAALTEGGAE